MPLFLFNFSVEIEEPNNVEYSFSSEYASYIQTAWFLCLFIKHGLASLGLS